jgi:hypothetical protein
VRVAQTMYVHDFSMLDLAMNMPEKMSCDPQTKSYTSYDEGMLAPNHISLAEGMYIQTRDDPALLHQACPCSPEPVAIPIPMLWCSLTFARNNYRTRQDVYVTRPQYTTVRIAQVSPLPTQGGWPVRQDRERAVYHSLYKSMEGLHVNRQCHLGITNSAGKSFSVVGGSFRYKGITVVLDAHLPLWLQCLRWWGPSIHHLYQLINRYQFQTRCFYCYLISPSAVGLVPVLSRYQQPKVLLSNDVTRATR